MSNSSRRQRDHYGRIHDDYEAHYYDETSMRFRDRFIYDVMFRDLDLNDMDVADLAAGSGHNSLAIRARFPTARVTGFDISAPACTSYRQLVGADAHELDLTAVNPPDPRFDIAMIVGGLHHCVADLPAALRTINGFLRPGGLFLMHEPNERFLFEALRKLWYRADRYFDAETEHALDHDEIAAAAREHAFVPIECTYRGGPAYFLTLNSLLFRIPSRFKWPMAPALFALESMYNRLPGKVCFPSFTARWRKRAEPAVPGSPGGAEV